MNGEQWDDILCILCMFEGTFLLDVAHLSFHRVDLAEKLEIDMPGLLSMEKTGFQLLSWGK